MKKVIIVISLMIVLSGCTSYLKHYRNYYYEGPYASVYSIKNIPFNPENPGENCVILRCEFIKKGHLDALRIFQMDNNGEILPNLGSDLIPFKQNEKHIDFDDSVIYIKECDGTYTEEVISSGIIDRNNIALYGDFDKSNCSIWLYKAEKNPLAKYFDK